jgi:hypothetical protein
MSRQGDCSNFERIAPFFISPLGIIRVPAEMPTVALADDTGHTDPETAPLVDMLTI